MRDPIYAALAAHRRSLCERDNACEAATSADEENATDLLFQKETEDLIALMGTEPTTIEGFQAMLAHLAGYVAAGYQLPDGPEGDINGSTTGLLIILRRAFDKVRSASSAS
jgi:hypothetical protein